jgi:hypothetical protein
MAKAVEIAREMGAKEATPFPGLRSYDAARNQSTNVQGRVCFDAEHLKQPAA